MLPRTRVDVCDRSPRKGKVESGPTPPRARPLPQFHLRCRSTQPKTFEGLGFYQFIQAVSGANFFTMAGAIYLRHGGNVLTVATTIRQRRISENVRCRMLFLPPSEYACLPIRTSSWTLSGRSHE